MHVHQQRCGVSSCEAPTHDRICPTHRDELASLLRSIATGGVLRVRIHKDWDPVARKHIAREPEYDRAPGLWEELETTLTRQAKMGRNSIPVRGTGEKGTPFHEAASDVRKQATATIRHWKAVFASANTHLSTGPTSPAAVCSWLASFPALLAQLADAVAMHADFLALAHHKHGTIPRVIDRAPDRLYLGICSGRTEDGDMCTEDVYAIEGYTHVSCRACNTTHEVAVRREKLRAAMEHVEATAVDCSRMADMWGTPVTTDRIRKWKQRGQLIPRSQDENGHPKYLMRDVFDLAAAGPKTAKDGAAA